MVVKVTSCGGDVIKFAGDCIIAVFPADDYVRQRLCLVCVPTAFRVAKAALLPCVFPPPSCGSDTALGLAVIRSTRRPS